jgi:hypothetical protein
LRDPAVTDPRAAEISFVGCSGRVPRNALVASTSTRCPKRELERLHAGLLELAALPDKELRALIGSLLAATEDA